MITQDITLLLSTWVIRNGSYKDIGLVSKEQEKEKISTKLATEILYLTGNLGTKNYFFLLH